MSVGICEQRDKMDREQLIVNLNALSLHSLKLNTSTMLGSKICYWFTDFNFLYPQRLQHQIDPNKECLFSKFEKKIPLCTSYIVASLQYQTKMANYHLHAMEMCLSLFNTASDHIMKTIASLEVEIIALFWMPIEFVGDYNTQKMSLKLIVKIFSYLNEEQKHRRINEINTSSEVRSLLLKLTENDVDFEKVSRELLNTFNMKTTKNCAVFSVYCRSALFGCYELFKPKDIDRFWIDFNYTTKSVSVLCDVKLKDNVRERISMQIKIDKLQIENQFDCIILSIEPAIFSKTVSTELNNARIAVFTLPQTEVQRLMANRDLVDFYSKTSKNLSSDLMAPASQNTINNFLAEEQEEERSNLDPLEGSQGAASDIKDKEIGYTPCISVPKPDSPIFKVPTKPARRRPSSKNPSRNIGAPAKRRSRKSPKSRQSDTQLNQSSSFPGKASKRFFKSSVSKPADLPRTQPISKPCKRPASNRNSGVSPKRKQVNTVRPLNHLTQPNCDPQEAALEYVENGGYANIISFIQSSAGLASFNDQQRQQILENVERINEDLDRSSRRFFPKALSSGTDSGNDADESKSRPKRKSPSRGAENDKFVPFSTWKVQQKQKSSGQSTVVTSKPKECMTKPVLVKCKVTLNAFDRLKTCNEKDVTSTQQTPRKTDTSPPWDVLNSQCASSSDSSGSNHNFLIVESDNEMGGSDMELSPTDMECRHEPQDMELSIIPNPIQIAHAPDNSPIRNNITTSPQVSLSSSVSKVAATPLPEDGPSRILCDLANDWASEYQPSEIFEDLEEVQSNKRPEQEIHEIRTQYSSEAELPENLDELQKENPSIEPFQMNLNEEQTMYSLKSSQSERNSTIIAPHGARGTSNWYIEKYLNDQQLFNQSPINVQAPVSTPPDPRPNLLTTNQVIIQNQIVVSASRKRPSPPHDESPFSKMSLAVNHIPFRGYAQLLPEYVKKMTAEKNRLLSQLERDHEENYFEKISQIADETLKTMEEHETEINEIQEQLSFCLGKLEWLIDNQQKKRAQLEGVYSELIQRIKSSFPRKNEVSRAYEAAEDELTSFATSTGSQLWQGFANNIVSSIETRLRDLVNF